MTDRDDVPGVSADPNALRYDLSAEPPRMDADPNALRYDPEAEPIELDENTRINPTLTPKAGGAFHYNVEAQEPDVPPGNEKSAKKASSSSKKSDKKDDKKDEARRDYKKVDQQNAGNAQRGTLNRTPATEGEAEAQHQQELEEKRQGTGELNIDRSRPTGLIGSTPISGPTGITGATGPRP